MLLRRVQATLLATVAATPTVLMGPSSQRLLAQEKEAIPPTVTTVLPDNVSGVLLLNTQPETWDDLNQFYLFQTLQNFTGAPVSPTLPYLPLGMSFEADVKPWIGDQAAIALLPVDPPTPVLEEGSESGLDDTGSGQNEKNEANEPLVAEEDLEEEIVLDTPLPDSGSPESPNAPEEFPPDPFGLAVSEFLNYTLMVAPIEQPGEFEEFVATFQGARNDSAVEETYKGVSILSWAAIQPSPGANSGDEEAVFVLPQPSVAMAVFPDHVAMASSPTALKQLIDHQAGDSLAENPEFQRTVADPKFGRSILVGYSNLTEVGKFAEVENLFPEFPAAPPPADLPAPFPTPQSPDEVLRQTLRDLAEVGQTLELFGWVDDQGLRTQSRLHYQEGQAQFITPSRSTGNQLLSQIPAATYLMGTGYDFNRSWELAAEALAEDPETAFFLEFLRQGVQANLGLNLEQDLFAWMDGEYGFFLFPSQQNLFNLFAPGLNIDVGVGVLIQTSDRPLAEATLQKLDATFSSAGGGSTVVPRSIGNQAVTSWEAPVTFDSEVTDSILAHGWVNDDTLLITTGMGSIATLAPQPYQSLEKSFTFDTAIRDLPQPNEGYVYANIGSILSFISSLLPEETSDPSVAFVQNILSEFVGSVRSLSGTSYGTETYVQSDFLLVLSPATPAAAPEQ